MIVARESYVKILIGLVMFMTTTIESFSHNLTWELYNSSLLIEVTRANGVFTCSGVAVSPDIVVTAAHCLDGDVKKVRVFTQETYDPTLPSLTVAKYRLHPAYNPKISRYRNDLAKIVLKERLPDFVNIVPVFTGTVVMGKLYRFGFGSRYNKNVRTVVVPEYLRINGQDDVVELNDKFSRSGDSGGPIYIEDSQGISILAVHSTFSHGPQGQFSYNPLLGSQLSWIYDN